MNPGHQKHVHHGRSTKGILDPLRVIAAARLKQGDVLLDAGCGDGFISIAASGVVGEHGRIYALDVYEGSIEILKKEILKKNIKNIEPVVADITRRIPLPDSTIDVCILANVLHGFVENNETLSAMNEILRVLKPGGRLTVVEFKLPSYYKGLTIKNLIRRMKVYFVGPPLNVRLTPERTEEILAQFGIVRGYDSDVGDYHYAFTGYKGI